MDATLKSPTNRDYSVNTLAFQSRKSSIQTILQSMTEKTFWRSLLLVQFQTQFILVISLGIFLSYCIVLYEVANAISSMRNELPLTFYMTDSKGIVYAFDAFYLVDVLLMLIYKNTEWLDEHDRYPSRNSFVLLVEAVTLIPIDAIYYNIAPIKLPSAIALLRIRYVLRLIRVYCQYKTPRPITKEPSKIRFWLYFLVVIAMASGTIGFMIQACTCNLECSPYARDTFFNNLYIATEKITGKGFGEIYYHNKLDSNSFIQYALGLCSFCYYVIFAYLTARVISRFFPQHRAIYMFLIKYTSIKDELHEWRLRKVLDWTNYEDSLYATIQTYYKMIWDRKMWHLNSCLGTKIIPNVMFRELYLDTSWNAFKHSHLFKDQDVYFLREVACRMQHTSYAAGEIIYSRNTRKGRMIYIRTGIVQVMSEENGEAPIISFSGGTCLGETSLLVDYHSAWTVVCKTYCEVAYLTRKDFVSICHVYPNVYRKMHRNIINRYEEAKRVSKIYNFQWVKYDIDNPETITMKWLKRTLHSLINNDHRERINGDESLTFYPDYLDMLVITEDLELVTDEIFLKKKFPPILQPESIFLDGWNILMAIISLIILMGYPCYMLICNKIARATHALVYLIVTFFVCVDVFVQCITAVKTKDSLLSNISSIIYYRLTHVEFLIDIFSVIPFSVVLNLINNQICYETLLLAESHKLLKVYRTKFIFTRLASLNFVNLTILNYVKVFLYDFLLFYYTSTIFYYIICADGVCPDLQLERKNPLSESNPLHILLQLYTLAALFMGNMSYIDLTSFLEYSLIPVVILLQFFYVSMTILILAFASIAETSKQTKTYQYKEYVSTMDIVLKDFKVNPVLQARVKSYLRDHFWFDKGLRVLIPMLIKSNMSHDLFSMTEQILHGQFLAHTSLFVECDELLIRDASRRLKITFYPKGEVVSYSGQICKEMHMIQFGLCQICATGKVLTPGESFCVLETCLQVPTFYTVVTVTDCKILSMSYNDYLNMTLRFPDFKESVYTALDTADGNKLSQMETTYHTWEYTVMHQSSNVPIVRVFTYKQMHDKERKLFSKKFRRCRTVLTYLLLCCTFPANGRFIFYWEISRLIFAFATCILSSFADTCHDCALEYVLLFLDITSWIDMFMRLHVCYYNYIGVEVSHPVKTAKHYIQNGFIIDFIAAAPLDYLGIGVSKSHLRTNRVLQLHRPFSFVAYINNNNISRSKLYDMSKYIPLTILVLNYLSSTGFYVCCAVGPKEIQPNCVVDEWVLAHLNKSTASKHIKQYAASIILTTMCATMISFTRFHLASSLEMFVTCCMVLCGHMLFVWITAKLVANSFYRKTDLTQHQEAMKKLLSFVNYKKVDKNIKSEIINHFENMWKRTKGKNIVFLLGSFNTAIKEDILYDIFGGSIRNSSIFQSAPNGFFKSLLQEAKYEVYIHKGIIYHVNDVHGHIFILLKGNVEIVGPDYNKLSILPPGSAFGNLDKCKQTRQTLMMVAKGNVEVLKVSAMYFHWVISKYTVIQDQFKKLTALNVDYVQNMRPRKNLAVTTDEEKEVARRRFKCKNYCSGIMRVYENNKYLKLLRLTIIVLSCFCGYHLELFQLANYENNAMYIAILYMFDLLYLLKMYLHCHTTFNDAAGTPVRDRHLITKRYFQKRVGFYFDLSSSIPLEIISLLFVSQDYFFVAFSWLRKNRLIRIFVCLDAIKTNQNKLNVNIRAMRICYMAVWVTIVLQSMATLLVGFKVLNDSEDLASPTRLDVLMKAYKIIVYTASGAALANLKIQFNMYTVVNSIILMLVCRFCITLFISETCSMLENLNQSKREYQAYALKVKDMMKDADVSEPLRKRIAGYFNLLWVQDRGVQFPHLLKESPYYLREAILNALYGFHLRKHPLLRHCHIDLIRQMAASFDVMIFFPGNFVTYLGDIDGYMYFIHKGEVSALVQDALETETAADVLVTGGSFGLDQGLYKHCGHNYSYKVTKKSVIIGLNRNKWFHLLDFFPASRQVLFELREEYLHK